MSSELRTLSIIQRSAHTSKQFSARGKGRGAMTKQYHTRSMSRNLYQDSQNQIQNFDTSMPGTPGSNVPEPCQQNVTHGSNDTSNQMPSQIDYTVISHMIESHLARLLQNMAFLQQSVPNHHAVILMITLIKLEIWTT